MEERTTKRFSTFEKASCAVTKAAGSSVTFLLAFLVIIAWLVSGPLFGFSDTWQLIINTGTTIITFLMVFLIQRSQNKESVAVQLKLNELIAAHETASNRLVCVEEMSEEEMHTLHRFYQNLSVMAKKEESMQQSHSIEEAEELHEHKMEKKKTRSPREQQQKISQ